MGKSNRRKGERPKRRIVVGMAEDLAPPTDIESLAYARRTLEQTLHGNMFSLNYLAYVEQGGPNVPGHGKPRGDDETTEQFELRRNATRLMVEAQAHLGSPAEQCVEELRRTPPSDAVAVIELIFGCGFKWCRETGFDPTANSLRDGAIPLLDAMCPDEHRDQAGEVLTVLWGGMVTGEGSVIDAAAELHPIDSIHVAAAITASLFSQPSCVPDRFAAKMELIEQCEEILKRI